MQKARRRRVPAFGEWNYSSSPDEPELPRYGGAAVDYWWYVPEPDAFKDVCFRYSPPPRKPKKARRPEADGGVTSAATPAEKLGYDHGWKGARARASDRGAVAGTAAKGGVTRRVLRPVDEDLYQVPPPDLTSGWPGRVRDRGDLLLEESRLFSSISLRDFTCAFSN
jgi:hypothetical protein